MSNAAVQRSGETDWRAQVEQSEGWLSLNEAELLYNLAGEVEHGCIVEIGAYRGRSAIALSAGAKPGVPVYSVDPHEEMWIDGKCAYEGSLDRASFYKAMLASGAWSNVRLLNSTSELLTPGWRTTVGLLWIDGDHSYHGVRQDWECWKQHLAHGCTVAFDDAHDERIGPFRLIRELMERGEITHRKNVGKVRSVYYRPAN